MPTHAMGPTLDEDTINTLRELADDDDPDFLADLIEVYLSDTGGAIPPLEESLRYGTVERTEIRRTAHTLKGASQNIGALRVAKVCFDLEQTAESSSTEDLDEMVTALRKEFEQAKTSLNEAIAS